MDKMDTNRKQIAQKKYRKTQSRKGLVRFELQVSHESKQRFEAMVEAASEALETPWDPRQRMAKARAQIFDEITQGIMHEFTALQQQIEHLREEVKALSPSFFKTDLQDKTHLPEAIRSLPDDPKQLKNLLAKLHLAKQQALLAANQYKRQAEQYEQLYEASSNYNEELKRKLQDQEAFIE